MKRMGKTKDGYVELEYTGQDLIDLAAKGDTEAKREIYKNEKAKALTLKERVEALEKLHA